MHCHDITMCLLKNHSNHTVTILLSSHLLSLPADSCKSSPLTLSPNSSSSSHVKSEPLPVHVKCEVDVDVDVDVDEIDNEVEMVLI